MSWLPPDLIKGRIEGLDEVRFVELCNSLLAEIAAASGISRSQLSLNYHLHEPDGGIDARCVDASAKFPRAIPRANTDFQFKSGRNAKSASAIAREDIIAKPRVREDLEHGHAFVIFSAWDRGDNFEGDLVQAVGDAGLSIDSGQLVFYGSGGLAHIVEAYPAIVARFLWIDAPGMMEITRWSATRTMSNPYQLDGALTQRIRELRERVEMPGSAVRIVGAAGDGKTRMVLEALRNSVLAESVLYLPQVSDLTGSLQSHIMLTRDVRCTLVIDEVMDADVERLTDALSTRSDGVRVVMIGLDASGRPQTDTLQVEGLDEDLLTRMVQAIVPGLSEEIARGIARDCERSPKLAVLLAELVREDPVLVGPKALKHGSVASALDRYIKLSDSAPEWKAISTACLLMRIGWSQDAESESTALFEAVGLDVVDARRAIDRLHERFGIAPTAGRYRYISPAILADHLAAKQLGAWTAEYLKRVFGAFTPIMADSFSRRARRLSAILPNRALIEEVLLGDQGPFRSLADLESSGMAMVLHRLAAPFPWGVLRALERCLTEVSLEVLRAAKKSRRDCVWALEEIQWREDTFERASKLLLRLAVAENETWGNNATNDWAETFQTMLGRTAAGAQPRLSVIRFAAAQPQSTARGLAAKAIRAAFETGQVSRMGNPPSEVEGMPAREWFPATYGEWWQLLTGYLSVLQHLTTDDSLAVKLEAIETLSEVVSDLFHVGDTVVEKWAEIAESLTQAPLDLRGRMFENLDWAVERWEEMLANEDWPEEETETESAEERKARRESQRESIAFRLKTIRNVREKLEGAEFQARLRSALTGGWRFSTDELERDSRQSEFTATLDSLALEALADTDLLNGEWQCLLDHREWSRSEQWIEALARADRNNAIDPELRELAKNHERARMWLSIYWLSRARSEKDETLVDRIVNELVTTGDPLSAFDLILRSEFNDDRVRRIVDLLRQKQIPSDRFQQITYSGWLHSLSVDQFTSILDEAPANENLPIDVVSFLEGYLRIHPEAAAALAAPVLSAIRVPMLRASHPSAYEWAALAKRYISTGPLEIGRVTLEQIGALRTAHNSELDQTLRMSWNASNKEQFFEKLIAPLLLERTAEAWWARQVVHHLPIADLGEDYLTAWIRSNPSERAHVIAEIIGAPFGRPSDLHARLLEEFGGFGVGSAFWADYNSGTFMGSSVTWTQGKLEGAKRWLTDERPAIRQWARGMVAGLEESLHREINREAEEKLMR